MANPFPLNIPEKEDSFEKEQLLANVDARFKYSAEEFNKILAGLTWLYLNSGGGGAVYFLGTYTSLVALTAAHPAPFEGSTANIDPGTETDVRRALWDNDDSKWVLGQVVSGFEAEMSAATSKPTPADADELPRLDSTDSNKLVKWTWANLKAALITAFNTVYLTIANFKEQNLKGTALINQSATGSVAINFNTHVHAFLNYTASGGVTITQPALAVGETVVRSITMVNNGFAVTIPSIITDELEDVPDITKKNTIYISYTNIDGILPYDLVVTLHMI